ncbi:MAG: site-specific integrase [Lachnospiraceae bacterium]|nr:site-specific integrase [Lachnospiraceae bacterium]
MKEKRYNGDGSITLRKDGRWMVRITKGFRADGKRNVVTRYAHSEQEAKKILKTLRVQLETRKIGAPGVTLNEYMEQFLEVYKKETVKAVSYDTYRVVFENHIRRELGYKKLADITKNDIQRLINEKSQVRSYSTISKMKVLLNMCFKHALEDDVVYKNPVAGVRIPGKKEMGVKARQIDILSQKEIDVLKEAALGPITDDMTTRFAPAFLLMLNTGIRMGEMLALTWQDIDMEEQVLHVNKTMTIIQNRERNEGAPKVLVTTSEPKSISSRRTVPLNSMAIRALIRMREYRGGELRETDYLLCNKNRGMVTQEFLYRAFDHILEKGMGDEYVHHGLHILRHTFATKALRAGIEIADVSKILGHGSVSVTYNTYIHVGEEQKRAAVERLEEIL